jgi:4-carboxymuconolactone decarboxylase
MNTDRMPPIQSAHWTEAQRAAAAALIASPRGEVRGPFVPLLRSPELLDRSQRLGEYLRYNSKVPEALKELAILITARHWRQHYEWHVHAPLALRAGIPDTVVEAVQRGEPPHDASTEILAVYHFCNDLQEQRQVGDIHYQLALAVLGEAGVVDLCGICGYYSLLAMVMNAARTPVPGNPPNPFE